MASGVGKTPATPAHVDKVRKSVLQELMIDTDSMRVSELIQIEKSLRRPYNQSLVKATESLAEMNKTINWWHGKKSMASGVDHVNDHSNSCVYSSYLL